MSTNANGLLRCHGKESTYRLSVITSLNISDAFSGIEVGNLDQHSSSCCPKLEPQCISSL